MNFPKRLLATDVVPIRLRADQLVTLVALLEKGQAIHPAEAAMIVVKIRADVQAWENDLTAQKKNP